MNCAQWASSMSTAFAVCGFDDLLRLCLPVEEDWSFQHFAQHVVQVTSIRCRFNLVVREELYTKAYFESEPARDVGLVRSGPDSGATPSHSGVHTIGAP
eukprot:1241345-Prymnesium_polylepis.2